MNHIVTLVILLVLVIGLQAQEIKFEKGNWQTEDISRQRILATVMVNEERVDTLYTEDPVTGQLNILIHKHPLARYEYYPDNVQFPSLWRMIDIRQESRIDSTFFETSDGTISFITHIRVVDIPNGAYQEFFLNGNIRIKGTLDGYNPDGTLKKMGTWMEWDAEGKMIREEHYP